MWNNRHKWKRLQNLIRVLGAAHAIEKVRGEKEIEVSSTQKLLDLKIEVGHN